MILTVVVVGVGMLTALASSINGIQIVYGRMVARPLAKSTPSSKMT